eukprot:gene5478-9296_t
MSESLPILYSFRRCPYAIRTRMTLYYSKIPVEIREVRLSNKPKSLLKFSPKGTVPVLILKDKVIDESLEIIKYALSKNDPNSWIKKDEEIPWKLINLVDKNGDLKILIDKYKYSDRYPEKTQKEYRTEMEVYLNLFEKLLKKNKFLIRDEISLCDICLFPFVRQLSKVDRKWFSDNFLLLEKWLIHFENCDLFKNVMTNYKFYNDDEEKEKIILFQL